MKKFLALISLLAATSAIAQTGTIPGIDTPNPVGASQTAPLPYALNPQRFFGNSVIVQIPSTFFTAGEALVKAKYPDPENYPKVVMTDETERPLLSLNITPNQGNRETIIHFFRDIKNDIRMKYPTSRFLKTDVIRNRTLAIIEVIIPNKDGENIYNMMAMRYVGENFFFFNFSCPEDDMVQWQNTAREIAETIRVESAE